MILFKIAYFRIVNAGASPDSREVVDPTQPLVLEIGLIPDNKDVEFENHSRAQVFKLPPGSKIIRLKAGDQWPLLLPEFTKVDFNEMINKLPSPVVVEDDDSEWEEDEPGSIEYKSC